MNFEDIYQFFNNPPPTYLNRELAVCYILNILLQRESYGTELIEHLVEHHPQYRLSDTVLYSALKFLEESGTIKGYWRKLKGRGRPRKMYKILPENQQQAAELAQLWQTYTNHKCAQN